MARPSTLLYVDPDAGTRRQIGEAFNRSGLSLRSIADPKQALTAARALQPDLILVHAELRSDTVAQVLSALAPDAGMTATPIALLVEDASEARFLDQLRGGVVALLQKPFYAPKHIGQVRALLQELPRRSGIVSGNGDTRELTALVEHIRRTQRTGRLVINAKEAGEEGRALFARGVVGAAELKKKKGVEALLAMVTTPRAPWSFAELGATPADTVIDLAATTGEHPLAEPDEVPTAEAAPGPGDGALALEVGDVTTGEEEIPIELELPDAPRVPPPSFAAPPPLGPNDRATKLLLVDDDDGLCRMFGLLFGKHGFEVVTEQDGLAGYEAALNGHFEIIVADLNMPRMDGWGMLRLLRDDYRTRELPVAFLSCHDDYRDALKAQNSGAQAYFSKATRLDALAGQVRALLDPRQRVTDGLLTAAVAHLSIGKVGPQWVLRQLQRQGATGVLEGKDGWATYRLAVREGRPVHAVAQAGRHLANGGKAFNAYIASKGAEGTFVRGPVPAAANLEGELDALLAEAASVLNENETRLREGLLIQASQIHVDGELYALYAQVGPKQWLETARLICEERLPPRDVIARVEASPIDVEETMKDLIRRGVVRLTA